jgi:cellulose biosynthesis protein BcsQ
MKILVTSLSGGTGKTTLAYNMAKRLSKAFFIDLTSNRHASVIFNTPMTGAGYQTYQAGHKHINELVVKSDNISFLPRGPEGKIEYESLKDILEIDGFDAAIVDMQCSSIQDVLTVSSFFDVVVVPMRCDPSVKAEVWLLNTLKDNTTARIIPVILRNKPLDSRIGIAVKIDEGKIRKHLLVKQIYTLEYDPSVHDRTWQNLMADGNYGKAIALMIKYLHKSKNGHEK